MHWRKITRAIRKIFEAGQACGGEHAVDIKEIHAWSSKELDCVTAVAVEKRWSVLLISRRQTQEDLEMRGGELQDGAQVSEVQGCGCGFTKMGTHRGEDTGKEMMNLCLDVLGC